MAWVKIPADNHPVFHAALPRDPRVTSLKMFGGVCGMVNGNMFSGLFARSIIARLSPDDQKLALALDGAEPFDPMGNGRVMKDTVLLPESVMDDPQELRAWIRRGLDYTATLPAKKKKGAKPKPVAANRAKAKPAAKKAKAKQATKATPKRKRPAKRAKPAKRR